MQTLLSLKEELCREDFNAIPFVIAGFSEQLILEEMYSYILK